MRAAQDWANGTAAFVISDVRSPNEAAMIRERGGVVWLITGCRGGAQGIAGHSSEQLDWLKPDLDHRQLWSAGGFVLPD